MTRNMFELPTSSDLGLSLGEKSGRRVSKKILRRMVWKRDKGTCQLCGTRLRAGEDWDLARKKAGGPYTFGNTFVAHHTCNTSQGRNSLAQTRRALGVSHKKRKKTAKKKRKSRRNSLDLRIPAIRIPKIRVPDIRF